MPFIFTIESAAAKMLIEKIKSEWNTITFTIVKALLLVALCIFGVIGITIIFYIPKDFLPPPPTKLEIRLEYEKVILSWVPRPACTSDLQYQYQYKTATQNDYSEWINMHKANRQDGSNACYNYIQGLKLTNSPNYYFRVRTKSSENSYSIPSEEVAITVPDNLIIFLNNPKENPHPDLKKRMECYEKMVQKIIDYVYQKIHCHHEQSKCFWKGHTHKYKSNNCKGDSSVIMPSSCNSCGNYTACGRSCCAIKPDLTQLAKICNDDTKSEVADKAKAPVESCITNCTQQHRKCRVERPIEIPLCLN